MAVKIWVFLLFLPSVAPAKDAQLPLSSAELKEFGVYPATIAGHSFGFLPEVDEPYGHETPDYLIQYWERGDLVVIAYGYGWGAVDHGFVFPMRKQATGDCQQCFTLLEIGEGQQVGEGSCRDEDKVRHSCQLSFTGNNWLGNYTEVEIGYDRNDNGKLTAKSFQTTVYDYDEKFIFGDRDNKIVKR